ncbi:hypothetical protein cyc_02352 [Cyclospora cayetanensis]|uniref:Uncharacterized protein n=1 Tax=Cyclospora cayetanensis TaxID=88456 RepID=A0A1D3D0Z4_9EIME|nr:hypothetical protein cyc_02352 [Cyclospora cayetanensis]
MEAALERHCRGVRAAASVCLPPLFSPLLFSPLLPVYRRGTWIAALDIDSSGSSDEEGGTGILHRVGSLGSQLRPVSSFEGETSKRAAKGLSAAACLAALEDSDGSGDEEWLQGLLQSAAAAQQAQHATRMPPDSTDSRPSTPSPSPHRPLTAAHAASATASRESSSGSALMQQEVESQNDPLLDSSPPPAALELLDANGSAERETDAQKSLASMCARRKALWECKALASRGDAAVVAALELPPSNAAPGNTALTTDILLQPLQAVVQELALAPLGNAVSPAEAAAVGVSEGGKAAAEGEGAAVPLESSAVSAGQHPAWGALPPCSTGFAALQQVTRSAGVMTAFTRTGDFVAIAQMEASFSSLTGVVLSHGWL